MTDFEAPNLQLHFLKVTFASLFSKESRFLFGNGEDNPPTAFIWKEEEIPLDNELAKRILLDKEKAKKQKGFLD